MFLLFSYVIFFSFFSDGFSSQGRLKGMRAAATVSTDASAVWVRLIGCFFNKNKIDWKQLPKIFSWQYGVQ